MEIYYDGSIEGLFTAFFYLYQEKGPFSFTTNKNQTSFFKRKEFPKEEDKFKRIKKYLIDLGGLGYYRMFLYVLASQEEGKEQAMFSLLKASKVHKSQALDLQEDEIFSFNEIRKNVSRERHAYLGLVRFSQLDNGLLFSEIKPKNDLLPLLMSHFINRLGPDRPFVLYDKGRNYGLAYKDGKILEEKDLPYKKGNREAEIEKFWQTFYQSVAIEARTNKNLRRSNMPKRYWEYLPELKNI